MQNIQMKDLRAVEVKSRQELRAWLEKNHLQTESVWLVSYKKTEPRYYIEYSTIVDERRKGLMTPAGLAVIERAKQNGSWNALKDTDRNKLPPDLKRALEKNPIAKTKFLGFRSATVRAILNWIAEAKRPETRLKRIQETVSLAQRNIRANQGKPK
jgi:uncharacterized protein YdeI (YjbR/CyaY-like superfamily)